MRKGKAASNEAASNGEERRSGPSGGESNQHNDDRALVIRVQSPSTQRPERVNSRAGSVAASSRSASHHTRSGLSRQSSSRLIVEEAPTATRSRSRSTQRTEILSRLEGPVEVVSSPHPASSHPRSSVSKESLSRHIAEELSGSTSQSHSTKESERASNRLGAGLALQTSRSQSKHTASIASRGSSKQQVVDQAPAARSHSRSTQRTDAGSGRTGSVKAAPSSRHENIGPALVVAKDIPSRQVANQASPRREPATV